MLYNSYATVCLQVALTAVQSHCVSTYHQWRWWLKCFRKQWEWWPEVRHRCKKIYFPLRTDVHSQAGDKATARQRSVVYFTSQLQKDFPSLHSFWWFCSLNDMRSKHHQSIIPSPHPWNPFNSQCFAKVQTPILLAWAWPSADTWGVRPCVIDRASPCGSKYHWGVNSPGGCWSHIPLFLCFLPSESMRVSLLSSQEKNKKNQQGLKGWTTRIK